MDPPSQAIEDYCKTIFVLSERSDGGAVSSGAVAKRLQVAQPSATAMLKRLDQLELITYEAYKGVRLTDSGRLLALEVLRRHRLLELFLAETFDMPWDRVHDEAEVLEHAISEELEELIAEKLGHPLFDPHGDPIPTRDGKISGPSTCALTELSRGDSGHFVRVSDSDPEMLRYLSSNGIAPGQRLLVADKQPFDGPLWIDFSSPDGSKNPGRQVIGHKLAMAMRVAEVQLAKK